MKSTHTHDSISAAGLAAIIVLTALTAVANTVPEKHDKKNPRSQSSQGAQETMPAGVIGVSLQVSAEHIGDPAKLYVAHIHPEGPARQAGLKHGDEVISVDGVSVQGKTYEEVVRMIRGEPGSAVKIQVNSEGAARDMTITRIAGETLYKAPMESHGGPAK